MILRRWTGSVRPEDLEAYLAHQAGTGIREYRETAGNQGALVVTRRVGDLVEVTTLSLWGSMEDVRRFAGDDPTRAVFYPGDDDLLAAKDDHVDHFDVVSADLPGVVVP